MNRSISDRDRAESGLGTPGLRSWPAAKYNKDTTAGATTAQAGHMSGANYVQVEYSAVGVAALTTRTAAQIIADSGLQIGDCYVLEIFNSNAGTLTLTAGSGVTITGTATVAQGAARFNVAVKGDAAITITRAS